MNIWDKVLEEIHKDRKSRKEKVILVEKVTNPCPDCGNQLIHQERMTICHNCGYEGPQ